MYDRFDQKLDLGINIRMSELNALLTYSVLKEIDEIIENKYTIAHKYIEACKNVGLNFIDPLKDGHRSNLYKFTLIASSSNPKKEFSRLTNRTSPVYDYALGDDPDDIVNKHICLPIWYGLENQIVEEVIGEIKNI